MWFSSTRGKSKKAVFSCVLLNAWVINFIVIKLFSRDRRKIQKMLNINVIVGHSCFHHQNLFNLTCDKLKFPKTQLRWNCIAKLFFFSWKVNFQDCKVERTIKFNSNLSSEFIKTWICHSWVQRFIDKDLLNKKN